MIAARASAVAESASAVKMEEARGACLIQLRKLAAQGSVWVSLKQSFAPADKPDSSDCESVEPALRIVVEKFPRRGMDPLGLIMQQTQ